ncbi:HAD family hydrolase [Aestuariirhabdus sp. LZHN29]|uniref:HAD family hydrolase n=1 Tax=Aestuariirhabdus sp. LZHN29 TaxID=3417462 RepID=UPI003CE7A8EB
MIDAISFDLDDTLWDNPPVIRAAEAALENWVRKQVPKLVPYYQLETLLIFRRELIATNPHLRHRISELREQVLFRALVHSGYPEKESQALASEGFNLFLEARHQVTPYPEAEALLQTLGSRFTLIALTNGNADVARLPLGRHFDHSVRAEQISLAKPDPDFYRAALQRVGVAPQRTLHIGDDLQNDVISARDAGLFTLWFNPRKQEVDRNLSREPIELQVERLEEIPATIKQWLARRDTH